MSLPFLPFARPTLDETMIEGISDTIRSFQLTTGPQVTAFEKALSDYHGGRPVRVVTSATAGMEVALLAMGVGPGDEVILPAQTFFACANAISRTGATPVFVDVELDSRNMDLAATERAITPKTKVLMPTHFAGLPMDLNALYALARRHGLRVIEDAALAIGSRFEGDKIGARGDIVSFSFHPNENMTSIEGGALTFERPEEAEIVDELRFHGIKRLPDGTRDVMRVGLKINMPDVHARLGLLQLERLDEFNAKRRALVAHYFDRLEGNRVGLHLPLRGDEGHSWNMFAPLLPLATLPITRKAVMDRLRERGIGSGISYEAIHLTTAYRRLGYQRNDFPHSEKIADETLTLPLFPTMTEADVERVCTALIDILTHP
jgi:dTDP-4-amino-4,6-dideoxygalactose transaminase